MHRRRTAIPCALVALALLAPGARAGAPAAAPTKCDVAGAGIEEAIAAEPKLREGANAQAVRDLRTLRDAAIVLETYHHAEECERLVAIVKAMADHPARTIEAGGDTDEDAAERVVEARKPRLVERGAAEKGSEKGTEKVTEKGAKE